MLGAAKKVRPRTNLNGRVAELQSFVLRTHVAVGSCNLPETGIELMFAAGIKLFGTVNSDAIQKDQSIV